MRTGKPLSVELGPGLMETIYDGIQRPLKNIADVSKSIYIPRGISAPALKREKDWDFKPLMKVGDHITGGDIWGTVYENSLLDDHKILFPPRARGTITRIAEKGSYKVDEKILEVEFDGKKTEFSSKEHISLSHILSSDSHWSGSRFSSRLAPGSLFLKEIYG